MSFFIGSASADQRLPPVSTGGKQPSTDFFSVTSPSRLQPGLQRTSPSRAHTEQESNNEAQPAQSPRRCKPCTKRKSPQATTQHSRCVTFPAHFSKTYKRTSPSFSVHVRAYTPPVSPRAFSPKSTQIATCPNPCPPQVLAQFAKALCHLMSPSDLSSPAPSRARAGRWAQESFEMKPRRLAAAHNFDVSTFRFFDDSPGRSSTCRMRCNRSEYVKCREPSLDCQRLGYES